MTIINSLAYIRLGHWKGWSSRRVSSQQVFYQLKKHSGEYGWVVINGWTCFQALFLPLNPQFLYLNLLKTFFGGKGEGGGFCDTLKDQKKRSENLHIFTHKKKFWKCEEQKKQYVRNCVRYSKKEKITLNNWILRNTFFCQLRSLFRLD